MVYGLPHARASGIPGQLQGALAQAAPPGPGHERPKEGGNAELLPWGLWEAQQGSLAGNSTHQGDAKVPEGGSSCSPPAGDGMGMCVLTAAGRGFSVESQEQTTNTIAEKCCFPHFAPINILLES